MTAQSAVLLFVIVFLACKTTEDTADLTWQRLPEEDSIGNIGSMTTYHRLGIRTNFEVIKVCIQGSPSYNGSNLILETKLAYAAWLGAGGKDKEQDWNLFRFTEKSRCELDEGDFQSVVIIASKSNYDKDQADGFDSIDCDKDICKATGSDDSYTKGIGGPATVSWSYTGNDPEKNWTKVNIKKPATLRLSPYLRWKSLEDELNQRISEDDDRILKDILKNYKSLQEKVNKVTYDELVEFNRRLKKLSTSWFSADPFWFSLSPRGLGDLIKVRDGG